MTDLTPHAPTPDEWEDLYRPLDRWETETVDLAEERDGAGWTASGPPADDDVLSSWPDLIDRTRLLQDDVARLYASMERMHSEFERDRARRAAIGRVEELVRHPLTVSAGGACAGAAGTGSRARRQGFARIDGLTDHRGVSEVHDIDWANWDGDQA